jgi:hypothetical protein
MSKWFSCKQARHGTQAATWSTAVEQVVPWLQLKSAPSFFRSSETQAHDVDALG